MRDFFNFLFFSLSFFLVEFTEIFDLVLLELMFTFVSCLFVLRLLRLLEEFLEFFALSVELIIFFILRLVVEIFFFGILFLFSVFFVVEEDFEGLGFLFFEFMF